jgi:hypothetical protein
MAVAELEGLLQPPQDTFSDPEDYEDDISEQGIVRNSLIIPIPLQSYLPIFMLNNRHPRSTKSDV